MHPASGDVARSASREGKIRMEPSEVSRGSVHLWTTMLGAGLLAGLIAWLGGEFCVDRIKPPRHAANSKGLVLNVTDRAEVATADAKNAGLAFAILGASIGLGLGVA